MSFKNVFNPLLGKGIQKVVSDFGITPDSYDASSGSFPTDYKGSGEVLDGNSFHITAPGLMGTSTLVNVGDLLIANTDAPGQTDSNWYVLESNRDQATEVILGVAKIATQATVDAGTNDTDFITALKLASKTYFDKSTGSYGDIITTKSGIKELHIEEDTPGLTEVFLRNTNDVIDSAGAAFTAKGSGADLSRYISLGFYGDNFSIPEWQGKGVLSSEGGMAVTNVGVNPIQFFNGPDLANLVNRFEIEIDGTINTNTPNYEDLVLDPNDIPNKAYVDSSKVYRTVGTGGDYPTVGHALQDGYAYLRLVSNVTETLEWGAVMATGNYIEILGDARYTLTLADIAGTRSIFLAARNVIFAVTGTEEVIKTNSFGYFSKCEIEGNTNDNRFFYDSTIVADHLTIRIGENDFWCLVDSASYLEIIGGGSNAYAHLGLSNINSLKLSGTFKAPSNTSYAATLNGVVDYLTDDATNGAIMMNLHGQIRKGDIYTLYFRNICVDPVVRNMTINHLKQYTNPPWEITGCRILDSCSLYGTGNINTKIRKFSYNIIIPNLSIVVDDMEFDNCTFGGNITISGDNNVFNKCRFSSAVVVQSTANNNKFIGCTSPSDISDSGTNTKIIMHTPETSDNHPEVRAVYQTVGTGGKYSKISEGLADGYFNFYILDDITEDTNWGTVMTGDNVIRLVGKAEVQPKVNFSVSNTNPTAFTIQADYIHFQVLGTNPIFNSGSIFHFTNCKISGDDADRNLFVSSITLATLYSYGVLTVSLGDYGIVLPYINKADHLKLVGGGSNWSNDTIGINGDVHLLQASGAFPGYSNPNSVRVIEHFNGTIHNLIVNLTSGKFTIAMRPVNDQTIIKNCLSDGLCINLRTSGIKRLYNCKIEEIGFYSGVTDLDVLDNCEIGIIDNLSAGDNDLLDFNIIRNCKFDISSDMIISENNKTIRDCTFTVAGVTINTGTDSTLITGCRTAGSITDLGTNSKLSDNF